MAVIYLVRADETSLYKIGVTEKGVAERIRQLQTGNGSELVLVHEFETEYGLLLERALHRYFYRKRTKGEWFKMEDGDVNEFMRACAKHEANFAALAENKYMIRIMRPKKSTNKPRQNEKLRGNQKDRLRNGG